MPGILPMKVIKCGSAAQSRIAQACDRCRSKKIRCDGKAPSCTQCIGVGFECKTSDKLSRRAFPRGYTESLEERVRQLEAEIRELKDLLDEREEKIDMMCKVRSGSIARRQSKASSPAMSSPGRTESRSGTATGQDDHIEIAQLSTSETQPSKAQGQGVSNVKSLTCALAQRTSNGDASTTLFTIDAEIAQRIEKEASPAGSSQLGRLATDRLVNVYFQELAPIFPVLHRPTVLKAYDDFVSSKPMLDARTNAQLHLIFSNAAVSMQDSINVSQVAQLETDWTAMMDEFREEESLVNLQCLTLATLYHLKQARYPEMRRYLGHAVAMSYRLGLHKNQTDLEYGPLDLETRKRTLWTLLTLDSFAAAHLGLPPLFDLKTIHCQYPRDVDDEYITNAEITPSLPGEASKMSSALALFKLTRILTTILSQLYSAQQTYRVSLQSIVDIESELKIWADDLALHLRLRFKQDKPSTHVVSDRSPLLALAYQYVQILVVKPLILARLPQHDRFMSAVLRLADSSKKILQITELLDERRMAFAFCLNQQDIVIQAISGLLWQCSELNARSTLLKETMKLCLDATERLADRDHTATPELRSWILSFSGTDTNRQQEVNRLKNSVDQCLQASPRGIKGIAQGNLNNLNTPRVTTPGSEMNQSSRSSRTDLGSLIKRPPYANSSFTRSEQCLPSYQPPQVLNMNNELSKSLIRDPLSQLHASAALSSGSNIDHRDWQKLLSDLDRGDHNIYDVIYGGPGADYCSASSASPEQLFHPNFAEFPGTNIAGQGIGAEDGHWNQSNGSLDNMRLTISNVALSHSSADSPEFDNYADAGFPIVIPDESTPSSIDAFDGSWIPELDPLLTFNH